MNPLYRSLDEDEIRLVTVSGGDELCSLELTTHLRTAAPEYDALSYCWGSDTSMASIPCNGTMLSIRASLVKALPQIHAHRPEPRRPLWIDAISLNQDDKFEKATHVPMMSEIYLGAARTVIWLGDASNTSDLAIDSIEGITRQLSQIDTSRNLSGRQKLESVGLPRLDDPLWSAIIDIQSRPWFYRLWTMQEIVLSQDALLLCGHKYLPWDAFKQLYDAAIEAGLSGMLRPHVEAHPFGDAGVLIRHVNFLRHCRASKRDIVLPILLTLSADRGYSVSVDRIWALLGLLNKKYRRMLRDEVSIDYSHDGVINYHRTFLEVMRFHIKYDKGVAMQLIEDNLRTSRHSVLPSWCPDWHTNVGGVPLSRRTDTRAGIPGGQNRYIAPFMLLNSNNSLELCGLHVDVVEYVTSTPGKDLLDAKSSYWLHECLEIIRKYGDFPRFKVYPDALRVPEAPPPPPGMSHTELGDHHSQAREILIYILFPESVVDRDSRHLGPCEGRKFFSTKAGRFGIGPSGLDEGDALCVMYGAKTAWALRPSNSAPLVPNDNLSDGNCELVGSVFTPSLCQGQAWNRTSCESMRRFRLA